MAILDLHKLIGFSDIGILLLFWLLANLDFLHPFRVRFKKYQLILSSRVLTDKLRFKKHQLILSSSVLTNKFIMIYLLMNSCAIDGFIESISSVNTRSTLIISSAVKCQGSNFKSFTEALRKGPFAPMYPL